MSHDSSNKTQMQVQPSKVEVIRQVLTTPVDQMNEQQMHSAWAFVDFFTKEFGKVKKELRARLLDIARSGEQKTASTKAVQMDGGEISCTVRETINIDEKAIEALLEKKGIKKDMAFDQVWNMNTEKVSALVSLGMITAEELADASTSKKSEALKVKPPSSAKELIDEFQSRKG